MTNMDRLEELLRMTGSDFTRTREEYPSEELVRRSAELFGMEVGSIVPWRDQIVFRWRGENFVSVICQYGSYGCAQGLLEAWDYSGEPEGWLTAAEAFKYITERLRRFA